MGMMDVSAEDNEIQKGHLLCKIFRLFFLLYEKDPEQSRTIQSARQQFNDNYTETLDK